MGVQLVGVGDVLAGGGEVSETEAEHAAFVVVPRVRGVAGDRVVVLGRCSREVAEALQDDRQAGAALGGTRAFEATLEGAEVVVPRPRVRTGPIEDPSGLVECDRIGGISGDCRFEDPQGVVVAILLREHRGETNEVPG